MFVNKLKRHVTAAICFLTFAANAAVTEQPNYVVKPTVLSVGVMGQKTVSTTFASKLTDGPYQLIVKNGSGEALEKQKCSGNIVKQLLCLASNVLIDVRILMERVSIAEIELNGSKIVTSKQMNSGVTSLQIPVQLKASNKLQIKIVGLPTASLTYELRGKAGSALSGTLAIINPQDNSNLTSYSTIIKGRVDSSAPNLRVLIGDEIEIPGVAANSEFNYQFDYLEAGPMALTFSLYSGATLLDTKVLNLNVSLPGESGGTIAAAGGVVSVSDSSSDLYGSAIEVPAGALSENTYLVIQHGDDWGPNIPAIYTSVGPIVSLNPILQQFSKPVKITVPYSSSLLPSGALVENIKILAYDGKAWNKVEPSALSSVSVSLESGIFGFYAYQAVVETPVADGQLQVLANVSGATVYVDGLFRGDLTPSILDSVSAGAHTVKVYRAGYNEVQQVISYPAQKRIQFNLTALDSVAPAVQLDPSLSDGMTISDNLIVINGQVSLDSSVANEGFVVLSQNSRDMSQALSADGKFSFIIPLFKGDNKIQVRATVNGRTGFSQKIKIIQGRTSTLLRSALSMVGVGEGSLASSLEQDDYSVAVRNEKLMNTPAPSKTAARSAVVALAATADDERLDQQIKVVLTWGKADTDVDMHVYDDYGGHAWYGGLGGIEQGTLDRDDVDGFGPEIFTLDRPRPGKYPVKVHYYSDHGNGATTATVQIFLAGQLVFQGSQALSSGQWWDVYTIDVQGITISNAYSLLGMSDDPMPKECQAYSKYTCVNHVFTTLPADSSIMVEVSTPESVQDSQIHYRVKEMTRNLDVYVPQTGRAISFEAQNKPLVTLINPAKSKRLVYEIVAYTDTGIESAPYYIVQDTRSQIRQEYIDKRALVPSFARLTPTYVEINDGSNFPGPNFYSYDEMIEYSDFAGFGFGVINKSIQFANTINSAYISAYPGISRLDLKSGWRNPRRNDKLVEDSSVDSYHQSGDSIDIVTPMATTQAAHVVNLKRLCEIAYANTSGTDVIYHANHVHIEPYNGVGRAKNCTGVAKKK